MRDTTDPRLCYVCLTSIPVHTGIYHADLGIVTHHHEPPCSARVDAERRNYDRSPRGRWRPRVEVLRRLRMASHQGDTHATG